MAGIENWPITYYKMKCAKCGGDKFHAEKYVIENVILNWATIGYRFYCVKCGAKGGQPTPTTDEYLGKG
jgi:hypothetical protein